ncbi:helix-turn-helix domain-containing protein [Hyphomicrobium sp.]|uniref:helix-turn-helix domain-containing protein n=1 Tax=Hyphomicrobium sp. TaxID=82 RepID=UPI0025C5E446|nr:helix-turn-helix domain-containing protein [Hyphomicrobium sp.]
MRRGFEQTVPVGGYEYARPVAARMDSAQHQQIAESRALIGQFFIDLRRALRLTLPQAAEYLQVRPEVIEALETGHVEYLPDWADTSAIVMTYTSMAGINGRPALNAIGQLISYLSSFAPVQSLPAASDYPPAHVQAQAYSPPRAQAQQFPYSQPLPRSEPRSLPSNPASPPRDRPAGRQGGGVQAANFMRAGSAIANGAKRLPQEALNQFRRRPQRALYAVSLPLGLMLLTLHSSIFETVSKPFGSAVRWASSYFQEHYGPIRDGMRYIEVEDPRSRRGDKLRIGSGSY